MRDSLRADVRDALVDYVGGRRHLAWIEVDANGEVRATGGALEHHGLDRLAPGQELSEHVPALGLLVEHELPRVNIGDGHFADLVLRPLGQGWTVLVLDCTASVERERALLQKGNELDLLREDLAGRSAVLSPPAELLAALGVALFERLPDRTLRGIEPLPEWAGELVDRRVGRPIEVDVTTFLGNFLIDAEELWRAKRAGSVRSGSWVEAGEAGGERVVEAIAVQTEKGHSWLALELLEQQFEERHSLLQRARETRLDYDLLRDEVEKKEVLLHCIVHDLKGPLASIVGVLSLLLRRNPSAERTRELLELALRQAHRQDEHIRLVLDVFKAEVEALQAWEQDPGQAPDLDAVAREQVERWLPAFEDRGRGLDYERVGGAGPMPVAAGVARLDRVIGNLLENALRHAPPESTVTVRVRDGEPVASLEVVDHGPGVDEDLARDLFRRFARGRDGGSSGLGLYFCRRTVERWGGSMRYAPTPGGGATFVAELRTLRPRDEPE